jgi:hypothetical protein
LFQELYEQNKSSPLFGKEIEARMICRRIFGCLTKEASAEHLQRLDELDKEGVMTPNLHFHLHNHLSLFGLRTEGLLSEAHKSLQKAEFYITWHLNKIPRDSRPALSSFYTTRMTAIHVEILLRLGYTESAMKRVGQMLSAFSQLPPNFRRLAAANSYFFLQSMRDKQTILAEDYIMLMVYPGAIANQALFSQLASSNRSAVEQASKNDKMPDASFKANGVYGTDELLEAVESNDSSPQNDIMTLDTFALQPYDATPYTATTFPSLDQYLFDNIEL